MKKHIPLLIAGLLLFHARPCPARDLVSIPNEVAVKMKKGGKLDLVWAGPGFDQTKGVKLGRISNESEDEASVVMDYFPVALSNLIKKDSPYTLNITVTYARLRSSGSPSNAASSARVEVEGRMVDQSLNNVAAFTAHASATIGGNEQDNARVAVRAIVYAITKDLFSSTLSFQKTSPAVIVAAPAKTPGVIVAVPAKAPGVIVAAPAGTAATQTVGSSPSEQNASKVSSVPPVLSSQPAGTSPAKPKAVPPQPKVIAPLIPASIAANMKKGAHLSRLWISPAYDKASGFSIGEVLYRVDARNNGIDKYLPDALAQIASKGAPCSLQLHVVELNFHAQTKGISSAKLGVEGILVAKDGTLLAAFTTRENTSGVGDTTDDCRQAARKMIEAITKDLR